MTKDDLLFILNAAADLSGHQGNSYAALSGAQAAVKTYVADKEELQDPDILTSIDRLLKISSASQVPGVFTPAAFDITDYVDPKGEESEPEATTPDDAPVNEPVPTEVEPFPEPVATEEPKE